MDEGKGAFKGKWPPDNFSSRITHFRKGNPKALVEMFQILEPDLNRYYWYCFGKADLVEEAMQEFYQLLIIRFMNPKYRSMNIALYKIFRKDAARRIRRFLRRFPAISLDDPDFVPIADKPAGDSDIFMRMQLMDCMDRLKDRDAQVIRLNYFDGLPLKEVPKAMEARGGSITYEAARQVAVRALKQLKDCMEEGVKNGDG